LLEQVKQGSATNGKGATTVAPFLYLGDNLEAVIRLSSSAVVGLVWAAVGCHCAPAPAGPHDIARSGAVPAGYVPVGSAEARCRPKQKWESLDGVPATSLFCDRATLERALEEQARSRGGSVLAGESCGVEEGGTLACQATVARASSGAIVPEPAPRGALGSDSDALSFAAANSVRIDLAPLVPAYARSPRPGAEVTEYALLPVGQLTLGVMRARCGAQKCDADQAQAALRAAAGGLGVPSLVGVRCFELDDERTCVATLASTERDPENDPRAH
jgi:hypothetical protein